MILSLPAVCKPRPWSLLRWNQVEKHRFHDCDYYDDCLLFICILDAGGWTCKFCSIFKDYLKSLEEENEVVSDD